VAIGVIAVGRQQDLLVDAALVHPFYARFGLIGFGREGAGVDGDLRRIAARK